MERIDVLELVSHAEYNGLDDFLMQNPFSIAFAKCTGKGAGKRHGKGTGKKGTGKKGTGKKGTGKKGTGKKGTGKKGTGKKGTGKKGTGKKGTGKCGTGSKRR